jgi:hypothetical protein
MFDDTGTAYGVAVEIHVWSSGVGREEVESDLSWQTADSNESSNKSQDLIRHTSTSAETPDLRSLSSPRGSYVLHEKRSQQKAD